MKTYPPEKTISRWLRTLGQPARLKILATIGEGEACVCHLEASLGMRQAYISQHLMALRKAGVLLTRREGRYIFYRLRDPRVLDLLQLAETLTGADKAVVPGPVQQNRVPVCVCPACAPAA